MNDRFAAKLMNLFYIALSLLKQKPVRDVKIGA